METLPIATPAKVALIDITDQVQNVVTRAGLQSGVCVVFVPHTTAALTFNENWDRNVQHDILLSMQDIAPADPRHTHSEGNSPAHIKASLFGSSANLIVEGGKIQLGTWQGIYLAEFDGPRRREVWLQLLAS